MFPAVFLALPLLLPMTNPVVGPRSDVVATVPMVALTPSNVPGSTPAWSGAVIPPLYEGPDGGFSLLLSPGSPCTAACVRLRGTF